MRITWSRFFPDYQGPRLKIVPKMTLVSSEAEFCCAYSCLHIMVILIYLGNLRDLSSPFNLEHSLPMMCSRPSRSTLSDRRFFDRIIDHKMARKVRSWGALAIDQQTTVFWQKHDSAKMWPWSGYGRSRNSVVTRKRRPTKPGFKQKRTFKNERIDHKADLFPSCVTP